METESEGIELIIILALVAVFIIFQLRRTLGTKTGYDPSEDKDGNPYLRQSPKQAQKKPHPQDDTQEDNVVSIRPELEEVESNVNLGLSKKSPFYSMIEKIHQFDRSFNIRSFYDGAEYAYGLILNAFWGSDRKILRSMLSRDVYNQFDGVINGLEKQNLHSGNKLMDIEKIDLVDVTLTGSLAEVTVEFTSHMIMSTKDEEDKVIQGDGERPIKISDIWTFCRDVRSSDPNWTLVATRTG